MAVNSYINSGKEVYVLGNSKITEHVGLRANVSKVLNVTIIDETPAQ